LQKRCCMEYFNCKIRYVAPTPLLEA
ncbi:uncharacterized protein METZ01_LOCUS440779, partial [marine metagenome]